MIAVVAGTRSSSGSTNFLRLHVVGTGEHPAAEQEERRKAPRMKPVSAGGEKEEIAFEASSEARGHF